MKMWIVALAAVAIVACGDKESESTPSAPPIDTASIGIEFVRIPAGSFDMGSDSERYFDQNPAHRVTISKAFELQTTEVTQAQWVAVMGANPSHFKGDDRPVEQVSWNDVRTFIDKLNAGDPGKNYRLPTEAEWEYACRAGTDTPQYGEVERIAWYHNNSNNETHRVATKQPNAWGLYDMLGNVWELVADWKDSYPAGPVTDPAGPAKGYYKVSRGGSWFDVKPAVNSRFRSSPDPDYRGNSLGFRLARD